MVYYHIYSEKIKKGNTFSAKHKSSASGIVVGGYKGD